MKKFLLMILLIFVISSSSYGAVSQDIYVRQDVFDAKMEALFERLHGEIVALRSELKAEISSLERGLRGEIRGIDRRIDDLRQDIYLGLVILGLLAGFPAAKEFFKWREERREANKQVVTLEDVKRLIAEAQLNGKTQP